MGWRSDDARRRQDAARALCRLIAARLIDAAAAPRLRDSSRLLETRPPAGIRPARHRVIRRSLYREVGYLTPRPRRQRLLHHHGGGPRTSRGKNRDFVDAVLERLGAMGERVTRMRRRAPKRKKTTPRPERSRQWCGMRAASKLRDIAAKRDAKDDRDAEAKVVGSGGRRRLAVRARNRRGVHSSHVPMSLPQCRPMLRATVRQRTTGRTRQHSRRETPSFKRLPHPPDRPASRTMRDVFYCRFPGLSADCSMCWRAPGGQGHCRVGPRRHFRHPSGGGRCETHARPGVVDTELDPIKAERAAETSEPRGSPRSSTFESAMRRDAQIRLGAAKRRSALLDGWKKPTCTCSVCWSRSSPRRNGRGRRISRCPGRDCPYLEYVRQPAKDPSRSSCRSAISTRYRLRT